MDQYDRSKLYKYVVSAERKFVRNDVLLPGSVLNCQFIYSYTQSMF